MLRRQEADRRLDVLLNMWSMLGEFEILRVPVSDRGIDLSLPDSVICLEKDFQASQCRRFVQNEVLNKEKAMILRTRLGMAWIGVVSDYLDEENEIVLTGPVWLTVPGKRRLEEYLAEVESDANEKHRQKLLQKPVVPFESLFRDVICLAYTLRDERLTSSQVALQNQIEYGIEDRPVWEDENHDADQVLLESVYRNTKNGIMSSGLFIHGDQMGRWLDEAEDGTIQKINAVAVCTISLKAALDAGISSTHAFRIFQENMRYILEKGGKEKVTVRECEKTIQELTSAVYTLKHRNGLWNMTARMKEYIQENLEGDIDLEVLAKHLHYTKYYMTRRFREEEGQSVVSYIHQEKVRRIQTYLFTTDESLSHISSRMGFKSPSYLNRIFKAYTGVTAIEFRSMCRQDPEIYLRGRKEEELSLLEGGYALPDES